MTDDDSAGQSGIITKASPRPVNETISRLTSMIAAKGMRLFAVIDQSAEAAQARLQLRETTLVPCQPTFGVRASARSGNLARQVAGAPSSTGALEGPICSSVNW